MIFQNDTIFVAGHRGLVGRSLVNKLKQKGFHNLILKTHAELDLTDSQAVAAFFQTEKPQHVILAAAKVGGIWANQTYPAEFFFQNMTIELNVIHQAYLNGVQRLLFLGSSCIYPKFCPQPMREAYLLTESLEPTNRPYAIAKIAGIEMCWAYNRQYGTQFLTLMPTNLYGPEYTDHLENSHVIPALIRKMHEAKVQNQASVTLWGTGTPYREFLFSDDVADACLHLLTLPTPTFQALTSSKEEPPLINIGCGQDLTIAELSQCVADTVGFQGAIVWDTTKPDGTPKKLLNIDKIVALGWKPKTSLNEGLQQTYAAFLQHLMDVTQ
jgi:GDP-L-fucose synthase